MKYYDLEYGIIKILSLSQKIEHKGMKRILSVHFNYGVSFVFTKTDYNVFNESIIWRCFFTSEELILTYEI